MHVGIIGGGMMGLATAHYLSQKKIRVTLIEKEKEIGGLSSSEEIMPGFKWDRFYHVILSNDTDLLEFIGEIGLNGDIEFKETKTGFYTDGQLHSMSNTFEFIKFRPLPLWSKFRLGAGILYAARLKNSLPLEKISAKTWITHVFGHSNFNKIFDPLLRSKLGEAKNEASGAFIWACIKRNYSTRHKSSKKELMGCVKGGYHSILNRIENKLTRQGVNILLNHSIKKIKADSNGKIKVISSEGANYDFDRVIATVPNPQITSFWPEIPDTFKKRLEAVDYLNLVCATLILKKKLSPYYITNLTDPGFPFTGLIDATNVVPSGLLNGKALVYLPRYMPAEDQFFHKSADEIFDIFLGGLRIIFPNFSEQDIVAYCVKRETLVQPIQKINYSKNIPSMQTPMKNFFIVNTTMILNSTLNNNQVIKLARKAADLIAQS